MDLLLLQGLGFSFGLADVRLHLHIYIYVCNHVFLAYTCVRCWARVTSHAPLSPSLCEQEEAEEECQDSFVRPGLEIQGGVLLLFSLHCHTRRQCFVSPIHGGDKLESSGEG